jgi:hypothetical protein
MMLRLILTFDIDWEKAPIVGSKPLVSVIKIMNPNACCIRLPLIVSPKRLFKSSFINLNNQNIIVKELRKEAAHQ